MSLIRITAGVFLLFSTSTSIDARAQELRPDPKISAWIEQLGSPRFSEREKAERSLLNEDLAFPWLKRATKDGATPEIRRRAQAIATQRRVLAARDAIGQLDNLAKRGEI